MVSLILICRCDCSFERVPGFSRDKKEAAADAGRERTSRESVFLHCFQTKMIFGGSASSHHQVVGSEGKGPNRQWVGGARPEQPAHPLSNQERAVVVTQV